VSNRQPAFFHFKVACTESMSGTLALTEQLIARASVTPDDQHCQRLLIERLSALGFEHETIESNGVTNLWAVKRGADGTRGKLLAFAGHTDVVPTGRSNNGTRRRSSRPIVTASSTAAARRT
jgi:Acetylornithine deacetylase/Succinyl-diaminopimelate desuccinylase and related deacylases